MPSKNELIARLWVEVEGQYVWVEMKDGDTLCFRRSGRTPHGPHFDDVTYRMRGRTVHRKVKLEVVSGAKSTIETVWHSCCVSMLESVKSEVGEDGSMKEIMLPKWDLTANDAE